MNKQKHIKYNKDLNDLNNKLDKIFEQDLEEN
jgi:hypothetical protein